MISELRPQSASIRRFIFGAANFMGSFQFPVWLFFFMQTADVSGFEDWGFPCSGFGKTSWTQR